MLDDKGYFYIIDAILAVMLLLVVFLVVNAAISIPGPDYSYESHDIRTAQDTMEILRPYEFNLSLQSFEASRTDSFEFPPSSKT